jgi:hypothetical protein
MTIVHDTRPADREVAKLDGPLRDEAVIALGKMGDTTTLPMLSGLQKNGPDEVQPSVAAAVCLLTSNCTVQEEYLKKTLAFASARENTPALLSRVAHALGGLGATTRPAALGILFDAVCRRRSGAQRDRRVARHGGDAQSGGDDQRARGADGSARLAPPAS